MSTQPYVLACIDGSSYSKDVCSYSAWIARTINAPLTQTNNISGMGGSPSDVGNQIGASASSRFNRGLSNAARQVPQRVSRA